MPRALTIHLDADLPLRSRPIGGNELSKIFGGCPHENDPCHPVTNPCCHQTMNDTGSGHFSLTCVGFTSGNRHVCAFV
jgi:hypothetical protein